MEAFNFKTNFIGHDGFVWWIGQIAPIESWIKNFDEVSQIDTELAKSWGIRYKVRIMGYHPYSDAELADDDLPWAQVLATAGNSGSLKGELGTKIDLDYGADVQSIECGDDNQSMVILNSSNGNYPTPSVGSNCISVKY